jgi:hypothetical protein
VEWRDRKIRGTVYRLSHLAPGIVTVPAKDGSQNYRVRLSYGHHVFTRELEPQDTPDFHFSHLNETRCFCLIRHSLSLHLPSIFQKAATGGNAYFGETRNFLFAQNVPGLQGPYAIFFDIKQASEDGFDAVIFVVSAYHKPNLPAKLPKIRFDTLIRKAAAGEPFKKPSR